MKIKLSSIMVENQATACAFYTEVLGFKKSKDIPVGEFRWLTVVSPDGYPDVELVLEPQISGSPNSSLSAL
jgi:catechol 2,3-dioxygenase-like lactoylglutathione lyase family enzyme